MTSRVDHGGEGPEQRVDAAAVHPRPDVAPALRGGRCTSRTTSTQDAEQVRIALYGLEK